MTRTPQKEAMDHDAEDRGQQRREQQSKEQQSRAEQIAMWGQSATAAKKPPTGHRGPSGDGGKSATDRPYWCKRRWRQKVSIGIQAAMAPPQLGPPHRPWVSKQQGPWEVQAATAASVRRAGPVTYSASKNYLVQTLFRAFADAKCVTS